MDDTEKDGSDSDWDSTLDFTSPRHPGNFMPRMQHSEIEDEESALSNESDVDLEDEQIEVNVSEKNVINQKNMLKPKDDRSRSPSPSQKENNIVKAQQQQQQAAPRRAQRQAERDVQDMPANQYAQDKEAPPYNFKEAVTGKFTPEPGGKGPPGKDKKGTAYDPAPSPTPRGIPVHQGSIRSVGSWDESDADERTLRDVRSNFSKEKLKEEEKQLRLKEIEAEQKSYMEDAPPTNRSETTWKSWAKDKIRKPKNAQQAQTQQQANITPQRTPQLQHNPRPIQRDVSQISQVSANPSYSQPQPQPKLRIEVSPPSETHSTQYQYGVPSPQGVPTKEVFDHQRYEIGQLPVAQYPFEGNYPEITGGAEFPDEPRKLFVYDEDRGRYIYHFGHGNLKYYEINEDFDEALLPHYADKCERLSKRAWQEIFAVIRMIFSVFIWFFIELFRYTARHIFQPIVHGVFTAIGDFVLKPLLSALFNGFMQPISIFLWNVFTGLRHMFRPVGEILERIFAQFAMLCRSIRLFEINWTTTGNLPIRQQRDGNQLPPAQVI